MQQTRATGITIDVQKILHSTVKQPYEHILELVRKHVNEVCTKELAEYTGTDVDTERLLRDHIQKYLKDYKVSCESGETGEELTNRIFHDMAEYSFITRLGLLEMDGFEELNANSWDDIELITNKGMKKLSETFLSPEHAGNIVKRILNRRQITIDQQKPFAYGDLEKGVRIAAMMPPIIDEECGIVFSIRRVNVGTVSKDTLLASDCAHAEELELLEVLTKYNISMVFGGGTGAGKTTAAAWLLSSLPEKTRLFTVEEGSREVNFIKKENGHVLSRVVHTLTRSSPNQEDNIDQTKLLELALRFHPKVLFMAEMRSSEAFAVQEAARTGHGVLATAHTKSAASTYMRLMTLGKQAFPTFSDDTLMRMMMEAFPIIIYMKQLEDGTRRLMRVIQGESYRDGEIQYRTLWRFVVEDTITDSKGFVTIKGHHERGKGISDELYDELIENGCPRKIADQFH